MLQLLGVKLHYWPVLIAATALFLWLLWPLLKLLGQILLGLLFIIGVAVIVGAPQAERGDLIGEMLLLLLVVGGIYSVLRYVFVGDSMEKRPTPVVIVNNEMQPSAASDPEVRGAQPKQTRHQQEHRMLEARRRVPPPSGGAHQAAPHDWDDVILPEATKRELLTVQRILHNPTAFTRQFGERLPCGLLLYGPPGTGKTLIARTLAHTSQYAFLSTSPAELNQMYLGESEKALRHLYDEARRQAPAVIFIDEIDASAGRRSGGGPDPGGAGRARDSTVNQLLQEIDGLNQTDQVVFTVGATNRRDVLDEALRSRLAYEIYVDLPNEDACSRLFKLYTRGYREKLAFPIEALARAAEGLSGRDIATLCQLAAIHAFGANRKSVAYESFAHAFERLGRTLPRHVEGSEP